MFVALPGWRLIPKERRSRTATEKLFEIGEYIMEVRVGDGSPLIGKRLGAVRELGKEDVIPADPGTARPG